MKMDLIKRNFKIVQIAELDSHAGNIGLILESPAGQQTPSVMSDSPEVRALQIGDVITFERRFDFRNDKLISTTKQKQTELLWNN